MRLTDRICHEVIDALYVEFDSFAEWYDSMPNDERAKVEAKLKRTVFNRLKATNVAVVMTADEIET